MDLVDEKWPLFIVSDVQLYIVKVLGEAEVERSDRKEEEGVAQTLHLTGNCQKSQ